MRELFFSVLSQNKRWGRISRNKARELLDEGRLIRLVVQGIAGKAAYLKRTHTKIRVDVDYSTAETIDPIYYTYYRRGWEGAINLAADEICNETRRRKRSQAGR